MGKHSSLVEGQVGRLSVRADEPGAYLLHSTGEVTGHSGRWLGAHASHSERLAGLPGRGPSYLLTLDSARRAFERDYLIRVLQLTAGNVTRAARIAGRNRTEFYRLLDRHALRPASFKIGREPATGTS